ncbi:MAG: cation transporter [Eubacterium sp.]|nr:cation transporter [Eubacterium sp.]
MTKLLISVVEKRTDEAQRRNALSSLSGITGIICNILLCIVKFTVGALAGSVSVTVDAVNNLSDCASNVVTLTGAKLSSKPDDKEHPFGHGRIEYISALIVAISIFVVSFEFAKSSVEKIINPEPLKFAPWYVVLLALSVLVKLWMAYFNKKLYAITDNLNLKGVMQDSINDSLATLATIASIILSDIFDVKVFDGIIGLVISVFIFFSGVGILKEVLSPLIGEPPSKELAENIESIITDNDIVIGVHDLVIHNYGAGKMLASADAEVNADEDVFTIHDAIDGAERRIFDELGVEMCIHMDPVDTSDGEALVLRRSAEKIVRKYNPAFSLHDFRIVERDGERVINFDLLVPFEEEENKQKIEADLAALFKQKISGAKLDINIEHSYIQ